MEVAPKGDVFCPKAGADCPNGEGDAVPKGLDEAPKPARTQNEYLKKYISGYEGKYLDIQTTQRF